MCNNFVDVHELCALIGEATDADSARKLRLPKVKLSAHQSVFLLISAAKYVCFTSLPQCSHGGHSVIGAANEQG